MQAFGQIFDPTLTYDGLKDLGSKLKLPAGWKYRVVTLERARQRPDRLDTTRLQLVLQDDDLQNIYDAYKEARK